MTEFGNPPDYGDQYDYATFVRRVRSVVDPGHRRRQIQRHLTTVDAPTVAEHLQIVLTRAMRGDVEADDLLLPLADFVTTASGTETLALEAIDLAAREAGAYGVAWYLLSPPPARMIESRALERMSQHAMSLGHRKAAATRSDRRLLERLALDDEPMVIEKLCANPRIDESLIMAIVTRRPTRPALLDIVARHPKWLRNRNVREGIAQNPYASSGLAIRLLPTLRLRTLQTLSFAQQVHPSLRDFAAYLVALRLDDSPEPTPDG